MYIAAIYTSYVASNMVLSWCCTHQLLNTYLKYISIICTKQSIKSSYIMQTLWDCIAEIPVNFK